MAVAGAFYPDDPTRLREQVQQYLDRATKVDLQGDLLGLVAPHAGYTYSGWVAAWSYKQLEGKTLDVVVVVSPSHHEYFRGCAVYSGDGYETPLGVVRVDKDLARRIASQDSLVYLSDQGHQWSRGRWGEHALEVQLPFLQVVLGDFLLLPIVMGDQGPESCKALGDVLGEGLKGQRGLLVVSSDLSHYHPYEEAVRLDSLVLKAFEAYDYYGLERCFVTGLWEACGGGPMVAVMRAAEKLGADTAKVLKYANSGDVPEGDKDRVVGYGAGVLVKSQKEVKATAKAPALNAEDRQKLLHLARSAVESYVAEKKRSHFNEEPGSLSMPSGAFVTLKKGGALRGCIGSVVAMRPLYETVGEMAISAAAHDPRFEPVTEEELGQLEYEISVLSPLRRVIDPNTIEVGKHGLLIRGGGREGVLLPQVPVDLGWDRMRFLEATCTKAGLPKDAWKREDTEIYAFTAEVFGEGQDV